MALWEARDSRWQVNDLGDSGKNVNNWHWTEKNAIPWSKERLKELLAGNTLVDSDGIVIKTVESDVALKGEAIINLRKGKMIPTYELDIEIGWKGTSSDGSEGNGKIKFPYVAEENHDERPELQVTAADGPKAEELKQALLSKAKDKLFEAIETFVKELHQGGPMAGGKAAADEPAAVATSGGEGGGAAGAAAAPIQPQAKPKPVGGKRTIVLTEQFYASLHDIYECFTEAKKMQAFTMSPASVDAVPGGNFSMFGGSIEGTFHTLEVDKKIEMDWRFSNWEEGSTSKVVIELEEPERGTVVLHLTQTNIPDADKFGNHDIEQMTRAGWKEQVLLRIKKVFGY